MISIGHALVALVIVMIWFFIVAIICLGCAAIYGTVEYIKDPDKKKGKRQS